ncbi:hypothetical protein [Bordetella trematum]|uniref:hypothetical protein n=1 Tax=Bordetella trematum TaxID=123899 RepID=UPI0039897966
MYISTTKVKEVFEKHDSGKVEEKKVSDLSLTVNCGEDLFGNKWTQILFTKGTKDLGMLFKVSDSRTNTLYTAECFNDEYRTEFENSIKLAA